MVDYTYQFGMSSFHVLDHFIVSGTLFDKAVQSVSVLHEVDNLSDHDPLLVELAVDFSKVSEAATMGRLFSKRLAWHKATDDHIAHYQAHLHTLLQDVNLPYGALFCRDVTCADPEHLNALNTYVSQLTNACVEASYENIPCTENRASSGHLPGWNSDVKPLRDKSLFWHHIWA